MKMRFFNSVRESEFQPLGPKGFKFLDYVAQAERQFASLSDCLVLI